MLAGPLPALVDHRKLANQDAGLDGELPVSHFPRFAEMLADQAGDVQVSLQFGRDTYGQVRVNGQLAVSASLVCQKCLAPFTEELIGQLEYLILQSETDIVELEDELDSIIHGDSRISMRQLLEDDLILMVPMIPRHADECPGSEYVVPTGTADTAEETTTHRPFAGLAEAIKKQNELES